MKTEHYARLFFVTDGKAYAVARLCASVEEANALCTSDKNLAVIDENALGVWVARTSGVKLPHAIFEDLRKHHGGMVFSNPHLRLACCSMGRVFEVQEIDAGDPEKQRERRFRQGVILISVLPDGRGVYGYQYSGIPYAESHTIWAD